MTKRLKQTNDLINKGLSYKQIAEIMFVEVETVRTYKCRIKKWKKISNLNNA